MRDELFTLFPTACAAVARVMADGARTHPADSWRSDEPEIHIHHAILHLRCLLQGDRTEPHLAHAACRLLMAIECRGPDTVTP